MRSNLLMSMAAVVVAAMIGNSASALEFPEHEPVNTYYMRVEGDNANEGGEDSPWASLERAAQTLQPGDELIIGGGLYEVERLRFAPGGAGPDEYIVYRAAPGERPVFTTAEGGPPPVNIASYAHVEGLWFGGEWSEKSGHVALGGSPISRGVRLVNCTIWGYSGGLSSGSAEDLVISGNRIINSGEGRFSHSVYLSGGYTRGAITQHVVIDNNVFMHGQGYAIHGWHNPRSCVITRNLTYGHFWGLVYGGGEASDGLIANNIIWRPTGQPGREGPTGFWIPGQRIVFVNNIIAAQNASFGGPGDENSVVAGNAYLLGNPPGFDIDPVNLRGADDFFAVNIDEFEKAAEKLGELFAGPAEGILRSEEVEELFAICKGAVAEDGALSEKGMDAHLPFDGEAPNIGRDTPAWRLADIYRAFVEHEFKHFDRNGEEADAPPAGWLFALEEAVEDE